MRKIITYLMTFFAELDRWVLVWVTCLTALLTFLNYRTGIDRWITHHPDFTSRFIYRYLLSLLAFAGPYLLLRRKENYREQAFLFLLLIAPAIFSFKMALGANFHFSTDLHWNHYWNRVIYWPLRLVILMGMLWPIWKLYTPDKPFFGFTGNELNWRPYAIMLLIMVPIITIAATQPDFLSVYPKLKTINGDLEGVPWSGLYRLLFELSYGSDFISIELFFRGFLILGFVKWAGKDAILPMACFYCTIHFGKPLGECISSYFGGLLLGIVIYHTRSIFGGLLVHLGIAWMMELAGYIAGQI